MRYSPAMPDPISALRAAIIHFWLVGKRGEKRLLEQIGRSLSGYEPLQQCRRSRDAVAHLPERTTKTAFISHLPDARCRYQQCLPPMPLALEALQLLGYDAVISGEAGPAKGLIERLDATLVTYDICRCAI